jgi:hypothetical protein
VVHKHGYLDEANVVGTGVEALVAHKPTVPYKAMRDQALKTEAYSEKQGYFVLS